MGNADVWSNVVPYPYPVRTICRMGAGSMSNHTRRLGYKMSDYGRDAIYKSTRTIREFSPEAREQAELLKQQHIAFNKAMKRVKK